MATIERKERFKIMAKKFYYLTLDTETAGTSQSLLSMVCNNEVMRFSVLHLQLSYQNISKLLSFSYENWLFSYL